jgi:hypothetical protein
MPVTISGTDGITIPNSKTINASRAYANFGSYFNDANPVTLSGSTPIHVPIYRTFFTPKNITVTTSASGGTWTHAYTGYYVLHIAYRQNDGGDIWGMYGVTKAGSTDVVGVSVRTGSENNYSESYHVYYRADSTSANYRLMGWSLGTKTGGNSGGSSDNPQFTSNQVGIGSTMYGRNVDIFVYRVGDL